jgi:ceramide glucosyltransferase
MQKAGACAELGDSEPKFSKENQASALNPIQYIGLFVAAIPFVYYFLVIYSSSKFFQQAARAPVAECNDEFTPPISNLKPVKGLDPDAYENFASLCRQNYPEYELIFCTTDHTDPSVPVIERLRRDFPGRKIRLLYSAGTNAINDKVAKLGLMVKEAQHEHLVINDSDVKVEPNYLRTVIAPLRDPKVGGVTCFYVSKHDKNYIERLQTIGMITDFYAGLLVAWELDGIHFALGPTMASTKERLKGFGGFQVLESRPADDLLFGRLIAEQGVEMKLLSYTIETVPDYSGLDELFAKRARWMTVMRKMRPWGHLGLLFTWGLPWSLVAVALRPTAAIAGAYLGSYLLCRVLIAWLIGVHGLKQKDLWEKFVWIPFWDAMAFAVWIASFGRNYIRWRGVDYDLVGGQLVLRNKGGRSAEAVKTER